MKIFEIELEEWYKINISFNWLISLLIIIITIIIINLILFISKKKLFNKVFSKKKIIKIDEVSLGIGNSNIKLKVDYSDKELAYKIWTEIITRKTGIKVDIENDVIYEVYSSWYKFFTIVRENIINLPGNKISNSKELICLCTRVLNEGIRPHLTKWQAKFRKWYEVNNKKPENELKTPQELQKEYPQYDDLINDMIITNSKMEKFQNYLYEIIFN